MNYAGTELALFQHALNWKGYWSSTVKRSVSGRVLDVGSGIGANASFLCNERVTSYTFLEPDAELLAQTDPYGKVGGPIAFRKVNGTTADLRGEVFDTVLYIDVLEHINDARAELERAFHLLAPSGTLILVVPAFQFLYSPFDAAIGHFRRYDRRMLRDHVPDGMKQEKLHYLDSAGLILSFGNKLVMRQATPRTSQIRFWDRRIIPLSKIIDPCIGYSFGRSLVGIYRKV